MTLKLEDIMFMVNDMADVIIENEVPFCELDSHAGDGDFGMSVAKGFKALKADWDNLDKDSIRGFLRSSSGIIMEECGGASGPIWGSAFRGAANSTKGKDELTLADFAELMQAAVKKIQQTGERSFGRGAVVGDKTLIDALVPTADSLTKSAEAGEEMIPAMEKAAQAAVEGAEKTKEFAARMGRAGTVGDRSIGWPDAGAFALGVIFTHVAKAMANR